MAKDGAGNQTLPSTGTTITTGNATLSITNFNAVSCGGQTGALGYIVLKTNTATQLGTCTTASGVACAVNDTGQGTSAYTPQTIDQTGNLKSAQMLTPSIGSSAAQQHAIPAVAPDTVALLLAAQALQGKTIDISLNTLKTATNAAGHVPRNNGAQYVDAALGASDLSDGVVGTGSVVRATALQGTDSKVLTVGTVSGTSAALCTDANGGATTSGCPTGATGYKIETVNTTPVTVSNTLTETNLMTFTLGANELAAGQVLRIYGSGVLSQTAGVSLLIKVKFDSTVLLTMNSGAIIFSGANTNVGWHLEGNLVCVSTGSSGSYEAQGVFAANDGGNITADTNVMDNTATITVNTTVSHTVAITATWGTASTSDTITQRIETAERLN